jgi:hypothetical protein
LKDGRRVVAVVDHASRIHPTAGVAVSAMVGRQSASYPTRLAGINFKEHTAIILSPAWSIGSMLTAVSRRVRVGRPADPAHCGAGWFVRGHFFERFEGWAARYRLLRWWITLRVSTRRPELPSGPRPIRKSFLVLFFKKELLPCLNIQPDIERSGAVGDPAQGQ